MTNQEPLGSASQQTPPAQETPPPFTQPAPTEKPKRNVVALIALIVSIVGFIFACIPGALIMGWILLPMAFVLAIVSLFLKGRGKGLGIAGLIVSIVGTIVGVIVFVSVVATSFDEAFNQESVIVEDSAGTDETTEEAPEAAGESESGTRENPVAVGASISNENWTVVVNSVNRDGNATVAAANSFNEAAPAGSHYEIVNYTNTYTGAESAFGFEVTVDLVTGSGNVVNSYDTLVVLSDGFGSDELFTGASATGSVAFVVPDGESVAVRVQPGLFGDEVFVNP